MNIDEFLHIMKKFKRFQTRLKEENIEGKDAEVILKIYIQDLTSKINTNFLKVV
ncbi:MAG: hypothetical protein M0Q14_08760 [Tissierellaceae bacterium]|nr:hypothetical protein [Tissierellaceae bacterium]